MTNLVANELTCDRPIDSDSAKHHEVRSLTGLRGIAALYVVMYHFKAYNLFGASLNPFFIHGYLAVDVFFVLSGFVMALTYKSLFHEKITFSGFRKFIGRRIARVYPLYFVVTTMFLSVFLLFPQKAPADIDFSIGLILSNFLMIQSWGIYSSIVGPGWSISTEFGAYILFPILITAFLFKSFKISNISALVFFAILVIFAYIPIDLINHGEKRGPLDLWDGRSVASLIRCVCGFSLGLWAYKIYDVIRQTGTAKFSFLKNTYFSIFIWLLFVFCLAIRGTDILIVFLLPFMIVTLNFENNFVSKLLAWKPIHYLGVISYSLYLSHLISIFAKSTMSKGLTMVGINEAPIVIFIFQILLSIILAMFFYAFVENPGRKILRKILK